MVGRIIVRLVSACALSVLAAAAPMAGAAPNFGDHRYAIAVRLDPEAHEVSGEVRIAFRNRSARPLDSLVFHLYPNAFEHDRTVFMRESGGALRGVEGASRGRITLLDLLVDGAPALARAERELVPGDRTQLLVPLEEPLAPGDDVSIAITFVTQLPSLFARSGHVGSFHLVAQFFPKLAKLDARGAWRSFPYHGHGEFFADFADYELHVEAPEGFTVAANGVPGQVDRSGVRPVHRFLAESVHDVAFVAWDRFRSLRASCGGVRVHLHFPEGGRAVAERSLRLACAAFRELGRDLGPYPYKDLVVVFPPRGAEGGAGMEYPGLVVSSAGSFHPAALRAIGPDATTAHELAHQWFQGIVASDEVRHPMIDEGLSTFFGNELLARVHGRSRSGGRRPPLDAHEIARSFLPSRVLAPAQPAHAFSSEAELYASVYGHVPLALETFARVYGRAPMIAALGHFARAHRFAHPGPDDLVRSFEAVYSPWFVDTLLRPALFSGETARFSLEVARAEGGQLRITARRRGSLPLPTVLALTSPSGRTERIPFPGDVAEIAISRPEGEVARAEIDPDRHIVLDPSRTDQTYLPRPSDARRSLVGLVRALFAGVFG